jgi:hypothetical protein
MSRVFKQLVFGSIYLALIGGLIWGAYRSAVPAPRCDDGRMNGREEGVDCGVVCGKLCAAPVQALENLPTQIIENSDGSWDVIAHLENPNSAYGAARVDYTLQVSDAGGAQLAARRGNTYVLPAQPRYIVFPLGKLANTPAQAVLLIGSSDVQWANLEIEAAGSVEFAVIGDQLTPASGSLRYEAVVSNRSRFDFDEVDVTVLAYDASGEMIAAGSTLLRTMRTGENRALVIDWPFAVPAVVRTQAIVTTNVFANDNFIRQYGSPEQFQNF